MMLIHVQSCLAATSRALTGFQSSLTRLRRKRFHTAPFNALDMTSVPGKPCHTLLSSTVGAFLSLLVEYSGEDVVGHSLALADL